MMGACLSMFFIKSWVILSSSSTSFMFRGTPPPGMETGPGGDGCPHPTKNPRNTVQMMLK